MIDDNLLDSSSKVNALRKSAMALTPEDEILCKRCGDSTPYLATELCNNCWEVEHRIDVYARSPKGRQMMKIVIDLNEPYTINADIFRPSGKWYTDEKIVIPAGVDNHRVRDWIKENNPLEGRLQGMTLVGKFRNDVLFTMTIPIMDSGVAKFTISDAIENVETLQKQWPEVYNKLMDEME